MSDNKKPKTLSWEEFASLGNPENIPEPTKEYDDPTDYQSVIRIFLEKKGRGGKTVSIIKGLESDNPTLKEISKELKSACGVGGSVKNEEIIIQGNHREKIRGILIKKGFKNVKLAGG